MDAFVSRKKRKLSPQLATQTSLPGSDEKSKFSNIAASTPDDSETESTDFKLALLSSLHPDTDQQLLLDILLEHEGSVLDASEALTDDASPPREIASLRPTAISSVNVAATGYQSSLSTFISPPILSENFPRGLPPKLLSKRGKTLHLYSPADVEAHTPCSIIHNFLAADEANALLQELLVEVETFERQTFKLFDNVVQSPHTACFFVESVEQMRVQKTEYIYNGGKLDDVRQLTPQMLAIAPKVTSAVNASIATRPRLQYQSPSAWSPNAAFVNCYNGPTESVGYHSDQLTYLGPRAIIGSISLGVAREFRVRRITPTDEQDPTNNTSSQAKSPGSTSHKHTAADDLNGQISIHLPHNSLLIMHASMQETWKHCISPTPSVIPHPLSGNRRINITYRDYKAYLHPRHTPRCKCGLPTVLRVVQRKKRNRGRYFWMCYAGNVPGKEGCAFFEWAEWREDGRPVWKGNGGQMGGQMGGHEGVSADR
ncbi:hypothetical protein WAI453_009491 [Rhynchosporium graminicola]